MEVPKSFPSKRRTDEAAGERRGEAIAREKTNMTEVDLDNRIIDSNSTRFTPQHDYVALYDHVVILLTNVESRACRSTCNSS